MPTKTKTDSHTRILALNRSLKARVAAKVAVPTVLDRILAQQKKAAPRKIAPARVARLLMNGKTLAIGLFEDGVEIHYCPAAIAKPDPFTYMSLWVTSGKEVGSGDVLTHKRGK